MYIYQSPLHKLPGSSYGDISTDSTKYYNQLKKRTKRRPYVRSAYFYKDKIFLDRFWGHLWDKNWRDRTRRLKFFRCGVELIQHSKVEPVTKENEHKPGELLHRFCGVTQDQEWFFVQIREDKRTGQKTLMSIFPGD